MDPTTTLRTILAGGGTATDRANYNAWIARGGFPARVQLHPATDAWMMGDRYGECVRIGTRFAYVKCDRSGRTRKVAHANVLEAFAVPPFALY